MNDRQISPHVATALPTGDVQAQRSPEVFAVVPAAGLSRRMGQQKLSMKLGDHAVIEHLVHALERSTVTYTVVVVGPSTKSLLAYIRPPVRALTVSADTPDMRATVIAGLDYVEIASQPTPRDAVLLAPADHPMIEASLIDRLAAAHRMDPTRIRLPTFSGKRGHPCLFPWPIVLTARDLPEGHGINQIVHQFADRICEIPVESDGCLQDVDHPRDFERLSARARF